MHRPATGYHAPAGGLTVGGTVELSCSASRARVIDAAYPADTDYDTHEHAEAYLCLTLTGDFREWPGGATGGAEVATGRRALYRPGSRHAVRTGSDGVRILHVTDPSGGDWAQPPGSRATGVLWQLAAATRHAARDAADDTLPLHLESLVLELDPDGAESHDTDWLGAVRARLREDHAGRVSLTRLAEDAGRHPAHLARAARARWGMTAGELLRRLRVSAAVRLLREGDDPLAVVALRAGFADQSHMGRWMRRYVGLTPEAVRSGRTEGWPG